MPAGRRNNSLTPPWRSKPAVKVCLYRLLCFLEEREPTKYGCAKDLGISRTTVIKWWNLVDWEGGDHDLFYEVFFYQAIRLTKIVPNTTQSAYNPDYKMEEIASDCGTTLEKSLLLDAIREAYVAQRCNRWKEYDLERVKVVGFFDFYWDDAVYVNLKRRNRKSVWKGRRRWKRC